MNEPQTSERELRQLRLSFWEFYNALGTLKERETEKLFNRFFKLLRVEVPPQGVDKWKEKVEAVTPHEE